MNDELLFLLVADELALRALLAGDDDFASWQARGQRLASGVRFAVAFACPAFGLRGGGLARWRLACRHRAKRPFSKRFAHTHKLEPSQSSSLSRVRLLLQKPNT